MDNKNHFSIRVLSAVLALIMVMCVFSSCGTQDDTGEITRGTEQIEKPSETTAADSGETTTSSETTTASSVTTTKAAGGSSDYVVTDQISSEVQDAVDNSSSGGGIDTMALSTFVSAMGFEYDSSQGVFYTNMDNWQRSANYVGHYDTFAQFGNMRYLTTTIDISNYDNLDWRIQLWKGQYGVFGGSEVGVYTKNPTTNTMLYNCADNDHLLYMESSMYLTKADYERDNLYFSRPWQAHWWLTGFKLGTVNPSDLVMTVRIRMKTNVMAKAFEAALLSAGFSKGDAMTQYDTYRKLGNDFYILWYSVGTLNYQQQK